MVHPPLRIFVSSPGDVTPERLIAKRAIDRLDREFAHHCQIEPILWERQPLVATEHFQAKITPPSETDIVVVIIWSRLGSPLPREEFPGPISGKEVTGTEWEFEDAVKSYRARKLPDLLVYRKQAPVMASLEDDAELERQRTQKQMVARFIQRWFVDEQAGAFKAASHLFKDSVAFEDMLETHLRELIVARIGQASPSALSIRWHEGSPFRGLESFEVEHAPIFFGRARARNELREALVRQTTRGCGFVLVFGASGSGKSSLVKAGLLPDLMLPGMVENVGLCRVATMRPSDVPGDLFAGLSTALLRDADAAQVTALPELADLEYDATMLAAQLRDAHKAELPVRQGLQAARRTARLADHAEARLAIVVDQLEELFTHEHADEDRDAFIDTLAALAKSGPVWVIATMRSDFFDRLATMPELARLSEGEGRYLLTPPSDAEIGQIIAQPAREAGLRFEQRSDGIPLDEQLREEASSDPAALPLLEFTLDQLWQQRVAETGMLTYAAYERLGGMEGALGRHAEEVFSVQVAEVKAVLPSILRALVTVEQGEQATATARTVPLASFSPGTPKRKLVEAFLDPEARLFVADGDGDGARVRVAHEALLRRWPRAARHIETDLKDVQTRTRLEQAALRWQQASDQPSLLLAPGLPLSEAEELVSRRRQELDAELLRYVHASTRAAREFAEKLEMVERHRMNGAIRAKQSLFGRIVSFLIGPPVPSDIPVRVQSAIKNEQESSEILIGWIQLGVLVAFAMLYALSPKTFSEDSEFAPELWALSLYFVFTVIRLVLAHRRRLPTWMLYLSVVVDMILLLVLIWSFHLQYQQPASFSLKAPTLLYVFIFIALRALRFQARFVIVAGIAAALGWLVLVGYVISIDPQITRDYVQYLTSNSVLLGAEFNKIISILMVTMIIAIAIERARKVLIRATLESYAATELSRFFTPKVAGSSRAAKATVAPDEAEPGL